MHRTSAVSPQNLMWLGLLVGILGLGLIANARRPVEVWSLRARAGAVQGPGPAFRAGGEVHEAADPWAISPTGTRLGFGFGSGESRPALLQ
jgi:hypothetical protein